MNRVLVIGIDSASPFLIEKWIDRLEHLGYLRSKGSSGILKSTIPPVSCPAWNSFMTGKNPGKLGVFDFQVQQFDVSKGSKIVDSTSQDSATIWEILSEHDRKVIVFNVPVTYPPSKLEGIVVSGFLTPLGRRDYTYPREFADELDEICRPYHVDYDVTLPQYRKDGYSGFLEECLRLFEEKVAITKHLLARDDWDFFITVFMILDRIQHYFWHWSDPSHPEYWKDGWEDYRDTVRESYERVDRTIGEILQLVDDDTNILIMSDHGFGPHYGRFLINNWLEEKGYLTRSRKPLDRIRFFVSNSLLNNALVRALINLGIVDVLIKERLSQNREWINRLLSIHMPGDFLRKSRAYLGIDWEATKAYGLGYGKIYINLKGRESKGIVDPDIEYDTIRREIIKSLLTVKVPFSNLPAVDRIYLKEDIYLGRHLNEAPDLVFVLRDWAYNQAVGISDKGNWQIPFYKTGDHRREGVWILSGPDVIPGKNRDANIVDLAPTLLHLLNVPIPDDIDGSPMTDVLRVAREPRYQNTIRRAKKEFEYSRAEEEELKTRLRDIGYID